MHPESVLRYPDQERRGLRCNGERFFAKTKAGIFDTNASISSTVRKSGEPLRQSLLTTICGTGLNSPSKQTPRHSSAVSTRKKAAQGVGQRSKSNQTFGSIVVRLASAIRSKQPRRRIGDHISTFTSFPFCRIPACRMSRIR